MAKPLILAKLANFFGVDGSGNILSNPATSKILTVGASVASNALTVTLAPCTIDFRSATLTSGAVNTRTVASALSLVVPSTATLGTINAVLNRQILLAIDNAGTVELAIVNMAGGVNLDETGVISTTAISASATSSSVVYSTTARTSVPYRVIGYVESTQATAGTWATAPSTIQGAGGLSVDSVANPGSGKWVNVTGSRAQVTTYYNTSFTDRKVSIIGSTGATTDEWVATIDGTVTVRGGYAGTSLYSTMSTFFTVPAGSSYAVTSSSGSISAWFEAR